MKIKILKVEKIPTSNSYSRSPVIVYVSLIPGWLRSLFGQVPKEVRYRTDNPSWSYHNWYIYPSGESVGIIRTEQLSIAYRCYIWEKENKV